MKCPKCGSDRIELTTAVITKKRRGLLWWLFIGWWLMMLIGIFVFLFRRGTKTKNITKYNCMNCGYISSNKNKFLRINS